MISKAGKNKKTKKKEKKLVWVQAYTKNQKY